MAIAPARQRQRRRRIAAVLSVALAALGVFTYFVTGGGARQDSHGVVAATSRSRQSRLVVRAEAGTWSGVLVANPAANSCRRVALPDTDVYAFAIAGTAEDCLA